MRHRLFMIWAALRWVLLMFLIAPVMEAPLVAHLNQPMKPVKSWVGNASWYGDRKSTRLNSSHSQISYAVFCLKKKKKLCFVAVRATNLYIEDPTSQIRTSISAAECVHDTRSRDRCKKLCLHLCELYDQHSDYV